MKYLKYKKKKKEDKQMDQIYSNYNKRLEKCEREIKMVYQKFKKKRPLGTQEIDIYKELKKLYAAEEKSANFTGVKFLHMNLMISITSSLISAVFFSMTDKDSIINMATNSIKQLDKQINHYLLVLIVSVIRIMFISAIALYICLLPIFLSLYFTDQKARLTIKNLHLIIQLIDEKIEKLENT
ncbi:hypothetical protein [Niallia taxi]|uniref:hypothetical protein n=1 Tax=Niallia taxi TaxID=2499688 RepID=UPI003D277C9F